jgi:hypothetical protein
MSTLHACTGCDAQLWPLIHVCCISCGLLLVACPHTGYDVMSVAQMIMGAGKTTVVAPTLSLLLAQGDKLVMEVGRSYNISSAS